MNYILSVCAIFVISNIGLAGWTSGGGKIHQDSLNPWFLENTDEVFYCVDVDEHNFGVTSSVAKKHVSQAIKEWKSAFLKITGDQYPAGALKPYGQIRLATQKFTEKNCDQPITIDLRFQFGALRSDQKRMFKDPSEYVGIAVRTNYDTEKLLGRGFIYLSPVKGPLSSIHRAMHAEAWSYADHFALRKVLLHELGHIFGIGHTKLTLMDEMSPELIVTKNFMERINSDKEYRSLMDGVYSVDRFLTLERNWTLEGCGSSNPVVAADMFGFKNYQTESCGKVQFSNDNLKVWFSERGAVPLILVGEGTMGGTVSEKASISVYLPPNQKVFSNVAKHMDKYINRLYGEGIIEKQKIEGDLIIKSTGEKVPLWILIKDNSIESLAIRNGGFESNIFEFMY